MKSKLKIISLLFLSIFLISGVALGATRFLFQAPGETYTPGSAKNSSGLLPQVAGVPFYVTVYSVNDSTWAQVSTNENSTIVSTQSTAYNPTVPFFLNEDSVSPAVTDCKRLVQVTIDPAVTASTRFDASGPSGIQPNSLTITVQKINDLNFNAITSPQTAGTSIAYTLTARMSGGATATNFQGTAAISAIYTGQYTTPVTTANFVNGVATGNITLYDSTEGGQRVTLTASVSVPTGVPAGLSTNFAVNPAAAVKLLLIGPGQGMNPGTNGGNGRTGAGSITETTDTVTSGTYFYVTVYAVDAYWNTVTSASGSVTLSSPDSLATTPAATALASGKAILRVTMGTAGTTVLTANHSGAYTADVDNIPVTYGAIDHIEFTSTIADKTANQLFLIYAVAHDINHNTVADFNNAVTFEALKGGSTPLVTSHWYRSASSPTFVNGVLNGTVAVRIYERLSSCTLRLTYNTATGTSNTFVVNPAAFNRLMVLAPGESFDPGAGNPIDDGKTGSPIPVNAGSNVPFTVYATDAYNNMVTSAGDTFEITSSDAEGLANSVTPPVQVTLAGGIGSFNFIFINNGTQGVYCNVTPLSGILPGSVSVSVQSGTISYFDFTNVSGSITAGSTMSPVVSARDAYGNLITSYTGNAWVTSPDTDWTLPSESTINISNGTLYGSAWYVTFTAGQATLNMSLRRAGSARIFVCDDAAGTTQNASGHRGLSAAITVNHGTINKMQVIPPGMTARPGTLDGIDGSPSGHLVADAFTVTANAVDTWWNVITAGTGSLHTIRLVTSDNGNAFAAKSGQALQPVGAGVSAGLAAGTVLMDVRYDQEQTNFYVEIQNQTSGSYTLHQTPFINIFNVYQFRIQGLSSSNISEQWAGTPFTITITAENSSFLRITSFAGVQVELRSSNQDSDSEYTLSPTKSVTFTAGVAIMQVTMYKASTTWTGSGVTIEASFGTVKSTSNSFNLWWGPVSNVLVRVAGMTHKPGLAHIGIPGYKGYYGSPIIVEAGVPFQAEVLYLDANYNRVITQPISYSKLTSSDPIASIGSTYLSSNNVYVTVTAGVFTSTLTRLRTVGTGGIQTITAEPGGSLLNNTSPEISLRHTTQDHFGISIPSAAQVAGVPFNITIQALDAFQNVCDNKNLGVAFNNSVNLQASTGANTMYPYIYTLVNGQAVASVRLFKAPEPAVSIQASYTSITGRSGTLETLSNEFKRLLITDNVYGGMNYINGEYTGAVPSEGSFPMVSGIPFEDDASQAGVSYQVGSAHFGKTHQFRVFACDAYGNITATADLAGNTVTITINDAYAQPVTPTSISATYGYNDIDLIFHTAKSGMQVTAHTTQSGIADYTTPTFTTYAGPAYGLQLLVPGISAVEGSGMTVGAFSNWYNGVTGIPSSEFTTQPFPVTVQAADIFGNFKSGPTNPFRVYTSSTTYINPYPASHPTNLVNFTGNLGDSSPGRATFTAMYDVSQARDVDLKPQDLSPAGPSNLERIWIEYPNVPIVMSGNLEYQIIVKGVTYGLDGTNSVNAVVLPDTFALTVNVVDSVSKNPVYGVNHMFRLTPVFAADINTPTGVTLSVPLGGIGNVINGVYTTILEGYSRADLIRIRVDDPNAVPVVTTGPKYSCIIDFGANSLNVNMSVAAVPARIGAGRTSQIRATVRDTSGNLVTGREVEFEFLNAHPDTSSRGTFGGITTLESRGGTPVLIVSAITDLNGIASADFIGDYDPGKCVIVARYFGLGAPLTATVEVEVSLVDPATEISSYPNPFMAGVENTYISFLVETPAEVKIKIYNLFGQSVWEEKLSEAEVTTLIQQDGHMITRSWNGRNLKGKIVGNGGYIAAIEAGSTKYKRKIAVRK